MNEDTAKIVYLLHKMVSLIQRVERKEVGKEEISLLHNDIYKLLENPANKK